MKISEKFKVREMAGEHVIIMPGRVGADMTRIPVSYTHLRAHET